MSLYRLSMDYVPSIFVSGGCWFVRRCRKVDARWADRVVDIDRRHTPKLHLRLLSPFAHAKGAVVLPSVILKRYWEQRRHG